MTSRPLFLLLRMREPLFEGNNVDAWAIWDPYLAVAETAAGARIIRDGTGLVPNRGYYLAAQSFVDQQPQALKTVLEQVKQVSEFAKGDPTEVAKFLSPALGIDAATLEKAEKRREYGVLPLTDEVINQQQAIADTFHDRSDSEENRGQRSCCKYLVRDAHDRLDSNVCD